MKLKAIRLVIMDRCPPKGNILDVYEVGELYRKDRKFSKDAQDMFDIGVDRLKEGYYVFLEGVAQGDEE